MVGLDMFAENWPFIVATVHGFWPLFLIPSGGHLPIVGPFDPGLPVIVCKWHQLSSDLLPTLSSHLYTMLSSTYPNSVLSHSFHSLLVYMTLMQSLIVGPWTSKL